METKIESIGDKIRNSLIRDDNLKSQMIQLEEDFTGKLEKLEQEYPKILEDLHQQLLKQDKLLKQQFWKKKEEEKGLISRWYDVLKPQIWVIVITGSDQEVHLSGFGVDQELGLIMTCAHDWCQWEDDDIEQIEVRRLGDIGFTTDVEVVLKEPQWDLAVLRLISGFREDCPVAKLAQDGSLDVGDTIFCIGHPDEYQGSCLIGSVAYKCIENVCLPQTKQMCKHFFPPSSSVDLGYRIYGHRWNTLEFMKYREDEKKFEENLHPMVPIIQGYGLHCHTGSSGGAIFNLRGEVVGLACSIVWKFDVAVHVTLLRHFLKMAINEAKCKELTRELVMHEDGGPVETRA